MCTISIPPKPLSPSWVYSRVELSEFGEDNEKLIGVGERVVVQKSKTVLIYIYIYIYPLIVLYQYIATFQTVKKQ